MESVYTPGTAAAWAPTCSSAASEHCCTAAGAPSGTAAGELCCTPALARTGTAAEALDEALSYTAVVGWRSTAVPPLAWALSHIAAGALSGTAAGAPSWARQCCLIRYQLLKMIILKFISSVLLSQLSNIFQYCQALLGITGKYRPADIQWNYRTNIAPAARALRRINSSNIDLPGNTKLIISFLEIDNVCIMYYALCIMIRVRIYGEI